MASTSEQRRPRAERADWSFQQDLVANLLRAAVGLVLVVLVWTTDLAEGRQVSASIFLLVVFVPFAALDLWVNSRPGGPGEWANVTNVGHVATVAGLAFFVPDLHLSALFGLIVVVGYISASGGPQRGAIAAIASVVATALIEIDREPDDRLSVVDTGVFVFCLIFSVVLLGALSDRLRAREARLVETSDQLRLRAREVEQFASALAHDLRNPLTIATGLVHVVEKGVDETSAPLVFRRIEAAHARMEDLIEDMLVFSRTSRAPLDPAPVDLGALVDDVARSLGERGPVVRCDTLPTLLADESLLRRLLENLLTNAAKYARPDVDALVEVRAVPDGATWRIAFTDNGVGIPAEHCDEVFEPFVRLDETKEKQGTGLGLAICRRVAERHDGSISARPGAHGGTTIELRLPDRR